MCKHTHTTSTNEPFYSLLVMAVNCRLVIASMYFKLFYVKEGKGTNGRKREREGEGGRERESSKPRRFVMPWAGCKKDK